MIYRKFIKCGSQLACVTFALLLSACGGKGGINDAYKDFRGKTSATIFHDGEKALAKHHFDEAVKQFEALDAVYPFGVYSRQGQLDIIYAYYMSGKMPSTMAAADRYIRLYPQGPYADYAYFMRGLSALQQEGSWLSRKIGLSPSGGDMSYVRGAYADMAAIKRYFPKSAYAQAAAFYMAASRKVLADHQMGVARFYFDHHAYLASANRARYVVLHYQGTPTVMPALVMMVNSYRRLGLTEQANNAYAVLAANNPRLARSIRR